VKRRTFLFGAAGVVVAAGLGKNTKAGKVAGNDTETAAAHAAHEAHLAQLHAQAGSGGGGGAAAAVAAAESRRGDPYVYGTAGPDTFDCSGLMMWAWAQAGVSIPRTSEADWQNLPHVASPQPGDLILYTGGDTQLDPPPGHVTMYIGDGQMIEAYAPGVPVRITPVRPGAWGYVRPGG
jgi:peptidoglycan DL-endopeptidase CwlO